MKTLYLIPARGGSERLPGKNLRMLGGKELIRYSIEIARKLSHDSNICVSTDCAKTIAVVEAQGLCVPFVRPAELATSDATSESVVRHALKWYAGHGVQYDRVVLLQPTSPFRLIEHVTEAIELCIDEVDLVSSVDEDGNLNGSVYVFNVPLFHARKLPHFTIGYQMPYMYSLDINTGLDLHLAEHLLKEINIRNNLVTDFTTKPDAASYT